MPAYSTSTNPSYVEIPEEVINYLRMVPVRDSNVQVWKKALGGLRKGSVIVVPECIRGDSATIHFSTAGNLALVGNSYITIYETVSECWTDAYWDGWLANGKEDSSKAIKEAVERIKSIRWWLS